MLCQLVQACHVDLHNHAMSTYTCMPCRPIQECHVYIQIMFDMNTDVILICIHADLHTTQSCNAELHNVILCWTVQSDYIYINKHVMPTYNRVSRHTQSCYVDIYIMLCLQIQSCYVNILWKNGMSTYGMSTYRFMIFWSI